MTSAHLHRNMLGRGSLHSDDTRFYTRIGAMLFLGLLAAVGLVWTGLWGRMLTWGDWGTLTVPDLLGLLIIGMVLLGIGLFALLFTMRASLRQVEVDLRVSDRLVDEKVAQLNQRLSEHMREARRLIDHEREAMRADHERHRIEWQDAVKHGTRALHAAAERVATSAVQDAARHFTDHPGQLATINQHLGDATRRLETADRNIARLTARSALIEAQLETNIEALSAAQKETDEEVRAGLIRTRAEILRSLDTQVRDRVADASRRQAAAIGTGAPSRAFHAPQYYRNLGAAIAAGIAVVGLSVLFGAAGPGILSARTAIFGLGLANVVLGAGLLLLTFSFGNAAKGTPMDAASTGRNAE